MKVEIRFNIGPACFMAGALLAPACIVHAQHSAVKPASGPSQVRHKSPAAAPLGPPIPLQLKFKAGDVNQYRMAAQVEARLPGAGTQPGVPVYTVSVDLVEQEKVNRALPDGGGELAVSTVSGQGVMNGQPFTPAVSAKPALITFDSRGDLVAAKDLPAEDASLPVLSNVFGSGALSMHGVFLPAHPVKVGDTWTKIVNITGVTGNSRATVKATFVKTEQIGRYKAAKIHAVMTTPLRALIDSQYQPTTDPGVAIGTLTGVLRMDYDTDLAIEEGKVLRAAGNGKVVITIHTGSGNTETHPQKTKDKSGPAHNVSQDTQMVMFLRLGTALSQ